MKKETGFGKFLVLWSGDLISQIGGGLTSFGLGVYIFGKTGSAAQMALVTLLGFLPTLVLSVPAGVLADMYDRRLLMMIGDGCSALGILYILIMMMSGDISLTQICAGVLISSVFSSLLEPSYRATVTDMLSEEEFTKASGLVSLSGSARYLVSPVIAGMLLGSFDIKLLLMIDICTFFITLGTTAFVKRSIVTSKYVKGVSFVKGLAEGWEEVSSRKGVMLLIVISSLISMFIGVIQILSEPLILSFTDERTLGISETVCALGMLVTALLTGIVGIRKNQSRVLSVSLIMAGVFMIMFSLVENIVMICIAGFLFFAMLPPANSCLDYLARTNIPNELQGRVWGFIGFISQLGYIPAYALSGVLADRIGSAFDIGVGRGSAGVIAVSGILLIAAASGFLFSGRIKGLERGTGSIGSWKISNE
ncbi:MAG: MFS transporter [Lachnospiraceae bacterium]|nr:MFS transporter [Lachnospiraceae bacterium]